MAQIPLPLVLERYSRFETFVDGENQALIAHLTSLQRGTAAEILWLWGAAGAGKSHLLQAACAQRGAATSIYLPLRSKDSVGVDVLEGLETLDVVALDDIDEVAGLPGWELALFNLYNRVQAAGGKLLLSAQQAPMHTPFQLADLASRAGGAIVYRVHSLADEQQLAALKLHADARGIDISDATARYLLTRVSRDMAVVCQWLDALDTASLVAKRKLTIPFIRDALNADA
jgi:DnaA-homolog protein